MNIPVRTIHIPGYTFDDGSNPYQAADATADSALDDVARIVSEHISTAGAGKSLLVRGVQSGKHDEPRDVLIARIIKDGAEYEDENGSGTIFAVPYADGVIKFILGGFHMFKPKSEERPQYPVDLWMLYDKGVYTNVEYFHPRHKVIARDKWKRIDSGRSGLVAIIEVD